MERSESGGTFHRPLVGSLGGPRITLRSIQATFLGSPISNNMHLDLAVHSSRAKALGDDSLMARSLDGA